MNIPKECKHNNKFKKDCCEVLWNGTIVENDGCVVDGGCDLIAYNNSVFFVIEIKSGNINSDDANKIVEQIEKCENQYNQFVGHRKKSRIFLHCIKKKKGKKRLDNYARTRLKSAKIIVCDCPNSFDLNCLD